MEAAIINTRLYVCHIVGLFFIVGLKKKVPQTFSIILIFRIFCMFLATLGTKVPQKSLSIFGQNIG